MGPQEERVFHPVAPLGVSRRELSRTSKEALLAVGQSRTNDLRETYAYASGRCDAHAS